jgi:Zn-dependent protease
MDDPLTLAVILIPCLVIAIVFHEVAHGWAALALGDPTAKERGRLTLNPLRHADPVGTLAVPLALALLKGPIFGWAKPVPVLKNRLNNPRWGMVAVAAAGPGSNFLMALIGAAALGLVFANAGLMDSAARGYAVMALQFFILVNVFIGFFNLLPIPPFDGSHIVEGMLPPALARHYAKLRPLGMVLLLGLIAITWFAPQWGVLERVVLPPVLWLNEMYLGLAYWLTG